ncbi:F117B protein, partial [Polypterus senegalus]
MKATVPFQLKPQQSPLPPPPLPPSPPPPPPPGSTRGSPTVAILGSPCASPPPTTCRVRPPRGSPERKSPGSPRERPRPPPVSPSSNNIRRTSSLDTLAAPYLSGHWPRDGHTPCAPCMRDKATQTPSAWAEEYSERKKGSHKRSASWGSTDQLKEIAKLRQQLQRSKHSSRHHREKDRQSPFHGNHSAINQSQTHIPKSVLIPIPVSKPTACRFRNSVEGLNQEIERITIKEGGCREEQLLVSPLPVVGLWGGLGVRETPADLSLLCLVALQPQDIPDGHRAPPPLPLRSSSTRSIDTQTPSGADRSSNSSSRSHSVSPSFLAVTMEGGGDSPCLADDLLPDGKETAEYGASSPLPKYACSPKPNNTYTFKREPPEGCERVKAFEEGAPRQMHEVPPFYAPDKNKVNFIPKSGSAFCLVSILKPLLPTPDLTFKSSTHSLALLPSNGEQERVSRGTSTSSQQPPPLARYIEESDG